uniref:Tyrosine-protein kinase ephrin type A/B receptor-like domain-containing protein n=1 Tax=Tetradesmus obliquus TaxID=3088 RepID=A0A383WD33_TETOB|eukprot:jgi/Sobl393_1/866/SZX75528.1
MVKAVAHPGYLSPAVQGYSAATFLQPPPAEGALTSTHMAADHIRQDASSTEQAMAAAAALNRRRQQRRRRLQGSGQLPAHLAGELADLMVPGAPAAADAAGVSTSSSTPGSSSSEAAAQEPAAAGQHTNQQQQQQGGSPAPQGSQQQLNTQPIAVDPLSPSSTISQGNNSTAAAAAPQTAVDSSNAPAVVTAGASKGSKKPGNPPPNLPSDPRPVGPRPPCNSSRGFEEQNGVCVCMPGYGAAMRQPALCVQCVLGWFSPGGPVGSAACRRCQDGTTSNPTRTACVSIIEYPDVNDALCKPCANRNEPFKPPSCCGRGQVCCGMWGCCNADVCYNNATTGNQPFCGAGPRCTVSGGTTPAEGAGPMSLCPVNTDCVNVTLPTTGTRCCRKGGQDSRGDYKRRQVHYVS